MEITAPAIEVRSRGPGSTRFVWMFVSVIAAKLILAGLMPLLGDEAYYIIWGRFLDLGYYDHPPMIGWISYAFSGIHDSLIVYRLYPVLSGALVGVIIHRLTLHLFRDAGKARAVTLIYLLSPPHLMNLFFLNDSPLVFFDFLAGVAFYLGLRRRSSFMMFLCGGFLGLAFLSKFLAVLMAPAFILCLVRGKGPVLKPLAWITAGVLPAILITVYWNYTNSWASVMFNLVYRQRGETFEPVKLLLFMATLVYFLTPWLLWALIRGGRSMKLEAAFRAAEPFVWLFLTPIVLLLAIGFRNSDPPWALSFLAFLYIPAAALDTARLVRIVKYHAWFAAFHVMIAIVIVHLPLSLLEKHKEYAGVVFFMNQEAVCDDLLPYVDDYEIMTATNYNASAVMSFHLKRHVPALFSRSKYGRLDDKVVDFRDFDGKDVLIFREKVIKKERYEGIFDTMRFSTFKEGGAEFHVLFGKGFRYAAFRDRHLRNIEAKYYTLPEWVPLRRCYFREKYFPSSNTDDREGETI